MFFEVLFDLGFATDGIIVEDNAVSVNIEGPDDSNCRSPRMLNRDM
jgi:hypothetical protein